MIDCAWLVSVGSASKFLMDALMEKSDYFYCHDFNLFYRRLCKQEQYKTVRARHRMNKTIVCKHLKYFK